MQALPGKGFVQTDRALQAGDRCGGIAQHHLGIAARAQGLGGPRRQRRRPVRRSLHPRDVTGEDQHDGGGDMAEQFVRVDLYRHGRVADGKAEAVGNPGQAVGIFEDIGKGRHRMGCGKTRIKADGAVVFGDHPFKRRPAVGGNGGQVCLYLLAAQEVVIGGNAAGAAARDQPALDRFEGTRRAPTICIVTSSCTAKMSISSRS